jgi:hypothetical protein
LKGLAHPLVVRPLDQHLLRAVVQRHADLRPVLKRELAFGAFDVDLPLGDRDLHAGRDHDGFFAYSGHVFLSPLRGGVW